MQEEYSRAGWHPECFASTDSAGHAVQKCIWKSDSGAVIPTNPGPDTPNQDGKVPTAATLPEMGNSNSSAGAGGFSSDRQKGEKEAWAGTAGRTGRPTVIATGAKVNDEIDLIVALPGQPFELRRCYSPSNPRIGYTTGYGWNLSVDSYVAKDEIFTNEDGTPYADRGTAFIRVFSVPARDTATFTNDATEQRIDGGSKFFAPIGPGTAHIEEIDSFPIPTGNNGETTAMPVWRQTTFGGGTTIYFRTGSFSSPQLTTAQNQKYQRLKGLIAQQFDAFGNPWTYDYDEVPAGPSAVDVPRLRHVFLHGTHAMDPNMRARLDFTWDYGYEYMDGTTPRYQQRTDMLRSVEVVRFVADGHYLPPVRTECVTDSVVYTYVHDLLDLTPGGHTAANIAAVGYIGARTCLAQATRRTLLNAPLSGVPHERERQEAEVHERYSQYRYAMVGSDVIGLKAIYFPAQLEYIASHFAGDLQPWGSLEATVSSRDRLQIAALHLLQMDDRNASETILLAETPGGATTPWNAKQLAGKWMLYESTNQEMTSEIIAGGSLGATLREDHAVVVSNQHSQITFDGGYSIGLPNFTRIIHERACDRDGTPLAQPPLRTKIYRNEQRVIFKAMENPSDPTSWSAVWWTPFTTAEAVFEYNADSSLRTVWVTGYEYDARNRPVVRRSTSSMLGGVTSIPTPTLPTGTLPFAPQPADYLANSLDFLFAADPVPVPSVPGYERAAFKPSIGGSTEVTEYKTWDDDIDAAGVPVDQWIHSTYGMLAPLDAAAKYTTSDSHSYKTEETEYMPLASWRPDLPAIQRRFSGKPGEAPLVSTHSYSLEKIWGADNLLGASSPRTKIYRIATSSTSVPSDLATENTYTNASQPNYVDIQGFSTSGNPVWDIQRNGILTVRQFDNATGSEILQIIGSASFPTIIGYASPVVTGPGGRALGTSVSRVYFNTEVGALARLSQVDVLGRQRRCIREAALICSNNGSADHYTYTFRPGGVVTDTDYGLESDTSSWTSLWDSLRMWTYVQERTGGFTVNDVWEEPTWLGPITRTYVDSSMNTVCVESRAAEPLDPRFVGEVTSHAEWEYDLAGRESARYRWWLLIPEYFMEPREYFSQLTEYDALGRTIRVVDDNGGVTDTTYDAQDRPLQIRVAANTALLSDNSKCSITTKYYDLDVSKPSTTKGGEGLLTYVRQTVGDGASDRIRRIFYNDLDQPVGEVAVSSMSTAAQPIGPWKLNITDLLGRVRETATASSELTIADVDDATSSFSTGIVAGLKALPHLNSREVTLYSSGRGLPYRTESAINPGIPTSGTLRTDRWYDVMDNLVTTRAPAAPLVSTYRDVLGRVTAEVTGFPDQQHDPLSLTAPLTSPAFKKTRTAYHINTTVASQVSSFIATPGSDLPPITTYSGFVYDPIRRCIATIEYGDGLLAPNSADPTATHSSRSLTSNAAAPAPVSLLVDTASDWFIDGRESPVPQIPADFAAQNPGAIITRKSYNGAGLLQDSIDPRGRVTRTLYDGLGRAVCTIENIRSSRDGLWYYRNAPQWNLSGADQPGHWKFDAPLPTDVAPDEYRVNSTVIDGLGNSVLRVAFQRPAIGDTAPAKQFSRFVYNIADTDGAFSSSGYRSASLLYEIRYPDPETGLPTTNDAHRIRYRYNQVGEQTAVLDQNGTTRLFTRDAVGRLLTDSVALPLAGSAVDTTAATIRNTYDTSGRVAATEMLDAAGLTLNKVSYEYDALGGVTALKQIAGFAGTNPLGGERIVRYDLQSFPRLDTAASGLSASYFHNWRGVLGLTYPDATPSSSTDDTELRLYADADHLSNLPATLIEAHHRFAISQPTLLSLRHGGADLGTTISNPTGVKLLANIRRLGMSRTVSMSLDIPQVHLDRVRSATGQTANGVYAGWDRFGRLKQQVWTPTAPLSPTSANANATPATGWLENAAALTPGQETRPLWQHGYGYSADSDRLWDDDLRPTFDGSVPDRRYTYDNLRRLTKEEKGRFSWPSNTQNFAAAAGSRSWSLDMLGNWKSVATDTNGDGTFNAAETSTRKHDASNQLTELGAANGAPAIDRAYDNNGNLISETVSGKQRPSDASSTTPGTAWSALNDAKAPSPQPITPPGPSLRTPTTPSTGV